MKLNPGDIFEERFEIISLLGMGGMASVFHARQLDASRSVAIKIPHLDAQENADDLERFFRESKILAKLSSPHIMTIYSIGKTVDDVPYAVCEYMEGKTLRSVMCDGPMDWQKVVKITLQVSIGLKDAHAQGVVHRDLKPENVFLLDKPEPDYVKVIDFGLSKMFIDLKQSQKLTKTGLLLGTAGYMSPELIAGKPVDYRCDIYALGCIIFEMLMGAKLFDADNSIGLIYKHSNESPEQRLAKLPSAVPNGIIDVLRKALAKKPEDRFQNMPELIAALELAAEGKTVQNSKGTRLARKFGSQMAVALLFCIGLPFGGWALFALSIKAVDYLCYKGKTDAETQREDNAYLSRSNLKILMNHAVKNLASHQYSEALAEASKVTDTVLNTPQINAADYYEAFRIQVVCLVEAERYEEASEILKTAEKIFVHPPASDEIWYLKAMVAYDQRNYDLAMHFLESKKILDTWPSATLMKAAICESRKDWQTAIRHREKTIDLWMDSSTELEASEGRTSDRIATVYLGIADDYINARDYKSGIESARKALTFAPKNSDAYVIMARAYEAMGASNESLLVYKKALDVVADKSSVYSGRAWFYFSKEDYKKCLSDCEKAIALNPRNPLAYNFKGLAFGRLGRIEDGIKLETQALSLCKGLLFAHEQRGFLYGCKGDWKNEVFDTEQELKTRPDSTQALNYLGHGLFKLQRYAEAKKAFEKTVSIFPDYRTALFNLSCVCAMTSDFTQANELAERARKYAHGAEEFEYCYAKALAALQQKDLKSAASFLDKAKKMIPAEPYRVIARGEFYCLQGMLHRDSGTFQEAMEDFSNAIKYDSTDAFVFQQRAKLFLDMKDERRAQEDNAHAAQLLR